MVADALVELKSKVCDEFIDLLFKLERGYQENYEFILEEISFIDLILNNEIDDKLSLIALLYYLNNGG